MGTAATATKTHGLSAVEGLGHMGIFELVLDTTDTDGTMTVDLTSHFKYVYSVKISGQDASLGYFIDVQKPAYDTALTSTNLKLGFYEAGADAAVLDFVASTDFGTIMDGLTIEVVGAKADVSSWA